MPFVSGALVLPFFPDCEYQACTTKMPITCQMVTNGEVDLGYYQFVAKNSEELHIAICRGKFGVGCRP